MTTAPPWADPSRCLSLAASRLHGITILRGDPLPPHQEGRAVLAHTIAWMQHDAREFLRLAVLAGRARRKPRKRPRSSKT